MRERHVMHAELPAVVPEVEELVVPPKSGGAVGRGAGESCLTHLLPRHRPQNVEAPTNWDPGVGRVALQVGNPYDDPIWAVEYCSTVRSMVHPNNRANV